ncbi:MULTISPECIES: FkbM family methyltransferase [Cyanophyceae]|uniref:FkbM family methyltransferase n=1 Tax=Cyanophyceae TaxID=3028117 RepID=UPI001683AC29|nr:MULTISPECIES: FkbM family methyltransferase [Cyanophyceae]MBD1916309.1 FkbM family methyltransferase [Phormidium sp. FACHB-77]MBD2032601.1 FkbM family methyltransferase [Phormidium sp. FACHB-322]MBD2049973.1 FkbM family methyltransferase [Leptolyngbya sp. FACHB-60]
MIENVFKKFSLRLKKTAKAAFQKTFIYPFPIYNHHTISFSQEGEDRILARLFERKEKGYYVDVGAHHPQLFSNTYLFYLRGWRGINIDAMPGSMDAFKVTRPDDINLERAIAQKEEDLTYYMFNNPAYNSFSEELSEKRDGLRGVVKLINQKTIKTQRLSSILDEYISSTTSIDFMSIDVEGLDYQVLLSNNWSKYRPKIILIEELEFNLDKPLETSESYVFLKSQGYRLFAKTMNTIFYILET